MKKLNKKLERKSFSVQQFACACSCLCMGGTPELTPEQQKQVNIKALQTYKMF